MQIYHNNWLNHSLNIFYIYSDALISTFALPTPIQTTNRALSACMFCVELLWRCIEVMMTLHVTHYRHIDQSFDCFLLYMRCLHLDKSFEGLCIHTTHTHNIYTHPPIHTLIGSHIYFENCTVTIFKCTLKNDVNRVKTVDKF